MAKRILIQKKAKYRASLGYFVRKTVMNFMEDKPTKYGVQFIRAGVIKGDTLVEYASKAAAVPPATMKMAVGALIDAVSYFCANGRRVMVPGLGSFEVKTRVKVAETPEEATSTKTIKKGGRQLAFWPVGEFKALVNLDNVNFHENKAMSKQSLGDEDYAVLHPTA